MEHLKWTSTAVEDQGHGDNVIYSAKLFQTPVKRFNEVMSKSKVYSNTMSVLPNHFTPPSGLTKFIARNPFESDLTNRLHVSVMSPTVFNKVYNIEYLILSSKIIYFTVHHYLDL